MADVSLRSVVKRYGALEVIHDATLDVADGEFLVFVGPSGCGKSTLLRMIAGLEDISGGEIRIGGIVVNDVEPADRGTAMVFQSYALYPHMTVEENLSFGLRMTGNDRADTERRVRRASEILRITELMGRRPRQLSGGQRQRVAIGRAIVREPQVFLFDEPLSNLDAELRVQMRVELARLHSELGVTMIYVTHDQVEAMTLADRIVVLRDGRIEQIGRPLDLYDDPANQFVAGFVGSPKMNFMAARSVSGGDGALNLELVNQGGARLALPAARRCRDRRQPGGRGPARALPAGGTRRLRPDRHGRGGRAPGLDELPLRQHPDWRAVGHRGGESRAGSGRLTVSIPAARVYLFDAAGARLKSRTEERDPSMTAAPMVRWGILGPGTIARTFADALAHSRTGRLVALGARDPARAPYAEHFPGARIHAGYEALLADRRGRCRLHRHAASPACRMGDQGRRGRQARAGREAGRALGLRGGRHVPRRAAGGHVHGRGLHVPPASRRPRG